MRITFGDAMSFLLTSKRVEIKLDASGLPLLQDYRLLCRSLTDEELTRAIGGASRLNVELGILLEEFSQEAKRRSSKMGFTISHFSGEVTKSER